MYEWSSTRELPEAHGPERAAARLHQLVEPHRPWGECSESEKSSYRAALRCVLHDLDTAPPLLTGRGFADAPTIPNMTAVA